MILKQILYQLNSIFLLFPTISQNNSKNFHSWIFSSKKKHVIKTANVTFLCIHYEKKKKTQINHSLSIWTKTKRIVVQIIMELNIITINKYKTNEKIKRIRRKVENPAVPFLKPKGSTTKSTVCGSTSWCQT